MTNLPGPLWPLMLPSRDQGLDAMCSVSAKGVRVRFADGRELLCGIQRAVERQPRLRQFRYRPGRGRRPM